MKTTFFSRLTPFVIAASLAAAACDTGEPDAPGAPGPANVQGGGCSTQKHKPLHRDDARPDARPLEIDEATAPCPGNDRRIEPLLPDALPTAVAPTPAPVPNVPAEWPELGAWLNKGTP